MHSTYKHNDWTLIKKTGQMAATVWEHPKLYITSTLYIDFILWHTQLIVYAVKCQIMVS